MVDYISCCIIFQGNVNEYDKVIYLVKHGAHFNGLRSIIAFLNRSYFCSDCCKGYNTEDAANHSCMRRNCSSCQRTRSQKGGCPDFNCGKKRIIHCKDCQGDFYGQDCYTDHNIKKGKKKVSPCQKYRKCLTCFKQYHVNPDEPHVCYHDTCFHCKEFVQIYDHKFYIQRVEMPEDEEPDGDEKKPPPLFVFGDIEYLIQQYDEGREVLVANLIRYSTEKGSTECITCL